MSTPYPPPPKKLERSTSNKVLGGVCGGVAKYLNMDPTLVRVLTVVISVFTGFPVIAYIIALFVIPEEGSNTGQQSYPPVNPPQTYDQGHAADSYQQPPTAEPAYGAGPSSTSSYGASAASQPSSSANQAAPSKASHREAAATALISSPTTRANTSSRLIAAPAAGRRRPTTSGSGSACSGQG